MIIEILCNECRSPNLTPISHPYETHQSNSFMDHNCVRCNECGRTFELERPHLREVGMALRHYDPLSGFVGKTNNEK